MSDSVNQTFQKAIAGFMFMVCQLTISWHIILKSSTKYVPNIFLASKGKTTVSGECKIAVNLEFAISNLVYEDPVNTCFWNS